MTQWEVKQVFHPKDLESLLNEITIRGRKVEHIFHATNGHREAGDAWTVVSCNPDPVAQHTPVADAVAALVSRPSPVLHMMELVDAINEAHDALAAHAVMKPFTPRETLEKVTQSMILWWHDRVPAHMKAAGARWDEEKKRYVLP